MFGVWTLFGRYKSEIDTHWTLGITFITLLAFKIEEFLVYLLNAGSPKTLLESIRFPLNLGVYLLSPILHSDGGHIASNLFWLVLFGVILEQRVEFREYVGFIIGVGIVSNFTAPFFGQLLGFSVGLAIGLSGATHALGMRETIYRFYILLDPNRSSRVDWLIFGVAIVSTTLLASILIRGVTDPTSSAAAHATGLFLGIIFGIAELDGFTKSFDLLRNRYHAVMQYIT